MTGLLPAGLPHSEILGSKVICTYPTLPLMACLHKGALQPEAVGLREQEQSAHRPAVQQNAPALLLCQAVPKELPAAFPPGAFPRHSAPGKGGICRLKQTVQILRHCPAQFDHRSFLPSVREDFPPL